MEPAPCDPPQGESFETLPRPGGNVGARKGQDCDRIPVDEVASLPCSHQTSEAPGSGTTIPW